MTMIWRCGLLHQETLNSHKRVPYPKQVDSTLFHPVQPAQTACNRSHVATCCGLNILFHWNVLFVHLVQVL